MGSLPLNLGEVSYVENRAQQAFEQDCVNGFQLDMRLAAT